MNYIEIHLFTIDIISDQELLWQQTITDDPATEIQARQGGNCAINYNPQLMHNLQLLVGRLVSKASQLIENSTTNLAESWMHIRCKYDGAKVVNRSQSGSWEHRCMGAGLQQNLGRAWGPHCWEEMTSSQASNVYVRSAESSATKVSCERKRKATDEAKAKRRHSKYSRTDDSTAARRAYNRHDSDVELEDDVTVEHLTEMKSSYYLGKVVVTEREATEIEMNTREQNGCDLWINERRKRLTASKTGVIAKMRKTTKRSTKVHEIIYGNFRGNEATRYGCVMEDTARKEYVTYQQQKGHPSLTTIRTGLVVSMESPWLAASPDDRVHDPSLSPSWGLAEYKNPYSARQMTLEEACTHVTSFCLEFKEIEGMKQYRLKRRHDYYFQVQCQLYCDDKEWCDFVVRTDKDIHVERIQRDREWWKAQMPKLKQFYFDAMLPELACPRYGRGGIREPS